MDLRFETVSCTVVAIVVFSDYIYIDHESRNCKGLRSSGARLGFKASPGLSSMKRAAWTKNRKLPLQLT